MSGAQNIFIDHAAGRIRLSAIFDMYRGDFTRDLTRRGLPATPRVPDYAASVAPDALRADLQRGAAYEVVFDDHDWSVAAH